MLESSSRLSAQDCELTAMMKVMSLAPTELSSEHNAAKQLPRTLRQEVWEYM